MVASKILTDRERNYVRSILVNGPDNAFKRRILSRMILYRTKNSLKRWISDLELLKQYAEKYGIGKLGCYTTTISTLQTLTSRKGST